MSAIMHKISATRAQCCLPARVPPLAARPLRCDIHIDQRTTKRRVQVQAQAQAENRFGENVKSAVVAGVISVMSLATSFPGFAVETEATILQKSAPTSLDGHIIDGGVDGILPQKVKNRVEARLSDLEQRYGLRLDIVLLDILKRDTDAEVFADRAFSTWYTNEKDASKKALLVLVPVGSQGGIAAGKDFLTKASPQLIKDITSANVGFLMSKARPEEAIITSLERLEAKLAGRSDPGPPEEFLTKDQPKLGSAGETRTFKTREETDASRQDYVNIVGGLLVAAVVIPTVQWIGFTATTGDDEEEFQ